MSELLKLWILLLDACECEQLVYDMLAVFNKVAPVLGYRELEVVKDDPGEYTLECGSDPAMSGNASEVIAFLRKEMVTMLVSKESVQVIPAYRGLALKA